RSVKLAVIWQVCSPPRKTLVESQARDILVMFPPGLLHEAANVRNDRIALVIALDDTFLHVDDEECGVRPVLECGHGLPLTHAGLPCLPTVDRRADSADQQGGARPYQPAV